MSYFITVILFTTYAVHGTFCLPLESAVQLNKFNEANIKMAQRINVTYDDRKNGICNNCTLVLIRKKRFWWNSNKDTTTEYYTTKVVEESIEYHGEVPVEDSDSWGSWFGDIGSSIKRGFKQVGRKLKSGINKIRQSFSRTEDKFALFIDTLKERVARGDGKAIALLRKLGILVKYNENGEATGSEIDLEAENVEDTLNNEGMLIPPTEKLESRDLTTEFYAYNSSQTTKNSAMINISIFTPKTNFTTNMSTVDAEEFSSLVPSMTIIPAISMSISNSTTYSMPIYRQTTPYSNSTTISTSQIYTSVSIPNKSLGTRPLPDTTVDSSSHLLTANVSTSSPALITSSTDDPKLVSSEDPISESSFEESTSKSSFEEPKSTSVLLVSSVNASVVIYNVSTLTNAIMITNHSSTEKTNFINSSIAINEIKPVMTTPATSLASTNLTATTEPAKTNLSTSTIGTTQTTVMNQPKTSPLPTDPTTPPPFPDIFKETGVRNRLHDIFLNVDFNHNDLRNIFEFDPDIYGDYYYDYLTSD